MVVIASCCVLAGVPACGCCHDSKLRRAESEQAGECVLLDAAAASDSLRYFNGRCVECAAAGCSPEIRSSVTSGRPAQGPPPLHTTRYKTGSRSL